MRMAGTLLVVIGQINVPGVSLFDAKGYAPIRGYSYAPETFSVAFERMQPKPREVQIARHPGPVQHGQDIPQFLELILPNSFLVVPLEKPLQALVPETLDHECRLSCKMTIVNYHRSISWRSGRWKGARRSRRGTVESRW